MSDLVDDYLRIMRSLNPDPVLLSRIEALEAQRQPDDRLQRMMDDPETYLAEARQRAREQIEREHPTAPLDVVMAVAREQMAKWKTTLDWLADR